MTDVATASLAREFQSKFGAPVVTERDAEYEGARAVWNAMVDTRPAVIARCRNAHDVADAVDLARESSATLAVRAGGHSVAGLSSCDGGVVIDLSGMRAVEIDPHRRTARVQAGATWADFDAAAAEHGLATTGGLISSTGVAGLTLGGGVGWLQRRYGLSCDNLIAADLVTATGEQLHVSESDNARLLWGLRGGGGNFGVVTQFQFALHPVSIIYGGLMLFPLSRGSEVLTGFRDWARGAADEISSIAAILTAPPAPFVPPELVGCKVVAILGCWCGKPEDGPDAIAALRQLSPAADVFGPMPYTVLQGMLDEGAPHGLRNYFRGGYLENFDDEVIDIALDHGARMPSPMSQIHFHQMGGAVSRVKADATAFNGRDAAFTYNLISTWAEASEDAGHIGANRDVASALAPLAMNRTYINFLADTGPEVAPAAYGASSYERLARLKREYDPNNLFRQNQNVLPAR